MTRHGSAGPLSPIERLRAALDAPEPPAMTYIPHSSEDIAHAFGYRAGYRDGLKVAARLLLAEHDAVSAWMAALDDPEGKWAAVDRLVGPIRDAHAAAEQTDEAAAQPHREAGE